MFNINWDIIKLEINRNIRNNRFINLTLLMQCIVCFTLIPLVIANTLSANQSAGDFKEFVGNKIYYTLSDMGDEDGSFAIYMRDSGKEYYKLYNFVNELRNNENFTFISTLFQPLDVVFDDKIPDKFYFGYEDGISSHPRPYYEDKELLLVSMKAIHVSHNVFSEFGISVAEGSIFSQENFRLDNPDTVKVILGNEYRDYYTLGDTFEAFNLFERMRFEIIGFLPQDTYMPIKGSLFYLDRYIIVPAFSQVDFNKYEDFAKITLSQQANGQIIAPPDTNINIPNLVNKLSDKYNTMYFRVYQIGAQRILNFVKLSDEIIKQLLRISLTLIFFTIVGLSANILGRIHEDYFLFGVHLISGGTLGSILLQMICFISIIVGTALMISLSVSALILGIGVHLLITVLVAVLVLGLSCIAPVINLTRLKVNQLIRRKE